jgi:uncharacterized protein (TIGR01777 family)
MKILITGATGLIGNHLGIELARSGHALTALTRSGRSVELSFPARCIAWDHKTQIAKDTLDPKSDGFDVVIHLAGEPVAQRWTRKSKQRIYDSRVNSTKQLISSVQSLSKKPSLWINASAIGIYGPSPDNVSAKTGFNESSPAGTGFLADVCRDWEAAASANDPGIRKVFARFGVVLSGDSGALPEMMNPFYYGVGGPIGSGKQMMSWIHIKDAVRAIIHCIDTPSIQGPVNLVASEPVSNATFSKHLGKAMKTPSAMPVPPLALKLAFGEMSSILTASSAVMPQKLIESGFKFQFADPENALLDLIDQKLPRGARVFTARQWLPGTPEDNFPFFSAAENLEKITPPWLNFRITKKSSDEMKSGLLIDYRLRIKGMPVSWRTRIEDWDPPRKFVDTQLKGPYRIWHHTHSFEPLAGGTLMTDRVIYKMYVWPLGDVALPMVKNDVKTIFAFRRKTLEKLGSSGTV